MSVPCSSLMFMPKYFYKIVKELAVKIVRDNVTIAELKTMAEKMFGGLVKAVVDVKKKLWLLMQRLVTKVVELMIRNLERK